MISDNPTGMPMGYKKKPELLLYLSSGFCDGKRQIIEPL